MRNQRVLDSYAVIAFFENEAGADQVANLIRQARDRDRPLLMSVVNWGEVYYVTRRNSGKDAAEETLLNLETLPVQIVPVDRELTYVAAQIKADNKMSYADAFAAGLALQKKASLVTGDREFKSVENRLNIVWL